MSFHEALFPLDISLGSEGGPSRRTDIVTLGSGREERNSPWAGSRRRYNAGFGVKSLSDIERIIAFFEARRGALYGFRFRDPFDHKSCALGAEPAAADQPLGAGDGARVSFQLIKRYSDHGASYDRPIVKPVAGSVVIAADGAVQTSGFSIDETTGVVAFDAAPASGVVISAGYVFDTPVRFDADQLSVNIAAYQAGEIPSIPLIEVLS